VHGVLFFVIFCVSKIFFGEVLHDEQLFSFVLTLFCVLQVFFSLLYEILLFDGFCGLPLCERLFDAPFSRPFFV
jgi:hypothetical protein